MVHQPAPADRDGLAALVPGATLAAAGYAAGEDEGMMVMGGITFLVGFCWAVWYGFTKDGINGGQTTWSSALWATGCSGRIFPLPRRPRQ